MKEKISKTAKLKQHSIKFSDLIVEGIHVNEEDLQVIRDRLNG